MHLVRRIQIHSTPLLEECTRVSKALYNIALYEIRQHFFQTHTWKRYCVLYHEIKLHEIYKRLSSLCGAQTAQQVLRQVDQAFKSFFTALKAWKMDSSKFLGRPRLPKYKKKNKRNLLIFTKQRSRIKKDHVYLTRNMHERGFQPIRTNLTEITGVRIVPWADRFQIELIYTKESQNLRLNKNKKLGIDIGLNNIVTAIDNCGNTPFIVKGSVLKSINQHYNKLTAYYKSLAKKCNNIHVTKCLMRLDRKRNNKIHDQFHKISRIIISRCIELNIGMIVVGYNPGWKQKLKLHRNITQNFAYVPFWKLLYMLEYKAKLLGIEFKRVTEEYTSQDCSVCRIRRKANRKHRGLYVCNNCGSVMNADVNAGRNILTKVFPDTVWLRDKGCVDHPLVFPVQ